MSKLASDSTVPQLDALVVLMAGLLEQIAKDKANVQNTKEKAATILVAGGLSQERTGKMLGMQKKKVVKAAKTMKI